MNSQVAHSTPSSPVDFPDHIVDLEDSVGDYIDDFAGNIECPNVELLATPKPPPLMPPTHHSDDIYPLAYCSSVICFPPV